MTRFTRRTYLLVLLALCVGALPTGCGGTYIDGVRIYPVSGRVLVQGQPLTDVPQGSVSFHPDAGQGNQSLHLPTGKINPDGTYELNTGGKKGAPLGKYKVRVSAFENRPEEGPVTPRYMLDDKYYAADKTDLTLEVVDNPAPGQYDLKVTKKAGRRSDRQAGGQARGRTGHAPLNAPR
jgi:hypothetical protein